MRQCNNEFVISETKIANFTEMRKQNAQFKGEWGYNDATQGLKIIFFAAAKLLASLKIIFFALLSF